MNGWYSILSYYIAKLISDLPLLFICPTLLTTVAYFMTGQPLDLGRFLMFWGIAVLTSLLAQSVGLVFGSAFNLQTGIFLGICIPSLLFSGFFIRRRELSDFLEPMTDVSFFKYSLEGLVQSIYGYNRTGLECPLFCLISSAEQLLSEMDMLGDLYGNDIIAIACIILSLNVLFYISLVVNIRRAQ